MNRHIPFPCSTSGIRAGRQGVSARLLALGAVAGLCVDIAVGCKALEFSEAAPAQAIVLFTVGQVHSSGTELKGGSHLDGGQMVRTGAKSVADIQLRSAHSPITFRLRENSEFRIMGRKRKGRTYYTAEITRGSVLVQSEKLAPSESLRVVTPTSVVDVRGTRLELGITGTGTTAVTLLEGRAAVRQRIPKVEDLPNEVLEASEVLSNLVRETEAKNTVIEPGQTISVNKMDEKTVPVAELERLVSATQGKVVTRADAIKLAAAMDREFREPARSESLRKSLVAIAPPAANPGRLSPQQVKEKLNEYKELSALTRESIANDAAIQQAVKRRNQAHRKELEQRIEQMFQKSAETVVLKNKSTVRGIVFEGDRSYVVLTVDGRVEIPRGDVDSVEF